MGVFVITPSAVPVELETLKAHLRVTDNAEDSLIEAYAAAAWAWMDGPAGWLGRSLREQTLELRTDAFGCVDRLPYGPVTGIVSVKYVDGAGVEQTLDSDSYLVAGEALALAHGATWPSPRGDVDGVRIRYTAGPPAAPKQAEQALLLLVGHWFRNRTPVAIGTISSELPLGVEALLSPLKRFA